MLAFVLLCLAPAVARAGTYEVWSCAGPDGRPLPADGWSAEGSAAFSSADNGCASRSGLYAALNGAHDHPVGAHRSWHFTAPPETKIASYRIWRAATADTSVPNETPVYVFYRGRFIYDGPYVREQCPAYGCHELGTPSAPLGTANLVTESNLTDVRDLWLSASCGGAGGSFCRKENGSAPDAVSVRVYRAAIVLQDDTDPVFTSPPAGSLTAGGALAGAHGVSFAATDTGSGLYEAIIEVDGRAAAVQPLGCSVPFTATVPCKKAASGTVTLDTASLPDGEHSVRVLVRDATRANAAVLGPFTITTSNSPTSCGSAPSAAVTVSTRRRTIPYRGRMIVRGQVPGAGAGVPVRLISRVARANAPNRLTRTPLTTDARGRFRYRVPPGPSRTLYFGVRGANDPVYQCSAGLVVSVRARVTLSATRSVRAGRSVRLRGRLRGGYVPAGGKLVELQAFDGGAWRSVRTVRTNAHGAFRYSYRFSRGAARKRYPFRAVVRRDEGYPWARGTSRRVNVRVR
jgi:hypothetical protein